IPVNSGILGVRIIDRPFAARVLGKRRFPVPARSGLKKERTAMTTTTVLCLALILSGLHAGLASAQDRPMPAPAPYPAAAVTGDPTGPTTTVTGDPSHPMPSAYITYRSPGCCGPIGDEGPIQGELYLRGGPAVHVGGGFLNHEVD